VPKARPGGPPDDAEPSPLDVGALDEDAHQAGLLGEGWAGGDDLLREAAERVRVAGPPAFARLRRLLASEDPALRRGAAVLLLLAGAPGVGAALADAFEREEDETTRRVLVTLLSDAEDPAALPALRRVWDDPREDGAVRRTALAGLARLGHPLAEAVLLDPRAGPAERRVAEAGLVRALDVARDDPGRRVEVVERIASEGSDLSARLEAVEALRRSDAPEAAAALARVASD
jgi:HEAT repeat protein